MLIKSHARLLAPAVIAASVGTASAQVSLLSNQSTNPSVPALATGAVAANGAAAPLGTQWSELQADATGANAVGGLAAHPTTTGGSFRLADNFTITGPMSLHHVTLYAYQSGASANPFAAVNLRIWNGRPGDTGSTVIFGDTTTNRLEWLIATGMYRVFNSTATPAPMTPDTSKPIWALDAALGNLQLAPGTYWLDWQIVPTNSALEAFTPIVTKAGARTVAGANARQFTTGGWVDAVDTGKPATSADVVVDLPFMLYGYFGQPPCTGDFNGDGDFGTDQDIEAFFACLSGNCCTACGSADFNGDGDVGTDQDIESFFRVLAGSPC